ncbi:alkyl hydroperoxide reductase subunit C [Candidatus Portiera aleyrodidarum]|uniref:Alkyl hydroperoxide reductase C n=1 Tax=Candidatus Portiera aleyrodidarum MED (Bemisia tabaci) TaxID=1163752 RepID=A0AAU8RYK6_9GAMM|nr:alkyl hydroperoxide reductase subunit C [Candidatus Portiera aleyrodidarum]AFS18941.1 Alkyl hydroperoxide reductase subunit C [Candidatus Portiera aleyrodidarum BT-QVLC]AFT80594.1 Alkyl hydroperoxide reductase protein C [Candidatus Portiera aleyrodidarum BT-QVLC]AJF24163.1 alkyl hydroperoxide reductase [Candidatus Portiera aleyrodidarum MED (Bemisia tabaci)]
MAIINKKIRPFTATAYFNGKFINISNEDLQGKWSVIFFYPADFSFVCPTELLDLSENYSTFKTLGVEIYSVSTDTHFTHKAWHDSSFTVSKIKFPMIGDPSGNISRSFNVFVAETGLAERSTFVIDTECKIKLAEYNAIGIGRNSKELIRKIQAAQYITNHPNEVCPANWTDGSKTFKQNIDFVGKF